MPGELCVHASCSNPAPGFMGLMPQSGAYKDGWSMVGGTVGDTQGHQGLYCSK